MILKGLKFDYYKSGGPGGQHKNKRFMAVRVTHLSTGLVALCQEYRSQARNKEVALERLEVKLKERSRPKKARHATKKSLAAKVRQLEWKKRHGAKKKIRSERFDVFA